MNKGREIPIKDAIEFYRRRFVDNAEKALIELYSENLNSFLVYAQRFSQDEHLKTDAFKEGMIAFYEYVVNRKYDPEKSSPKTMIFNMSLRYLNNRLKKEQRLISSESIIQEEVNEWMQVYEIELNPHEVELKKAFQQLGKKCKELLKLFYYKKYDIETIVLELGYKNANTVSAHKSRCVKQLKSIIRKK